MSLAKMEDQIHCIKKLQTLCYLGKRYKKIACQEYVKHMNLNGHTNPKTFSWSCCHHENYWLTASQDAIRLTTTIKKF